MSRTYLFYILLTMLSVGALKLRGSQRIKESHSLRLTLLAFSFLTLFLPLVFRDISVGTDYVVYRDTFNAIISNNAISDSTAAWLGMPFIYTARAVSPFVLESYVLFYALMSFATLCFLYAAILKSKIPWLSLFLFISFCLYFQMFNQMRQMLAICMALYSVKHIINRNITRFLVTIGVASTFHMSAILFLPMYFLAKADITFKRILPIAMVGIVTALSFPFIAKLALFTPYGAAYAGTWLDVAFSVGSIQNLAFRLALLAGCLLYSKRTIAKFPEMKYYYNLGVYCTLIQILAVYSSLFGRLTTMYFIGYVMLIPAIFSANIKANAYRWSMTLLVGLLMVYQYVYFYSDNGASAAGYDTYLPGKVRIYNE